MAGEPEYEKRVNVRGGHYFVVKAANGEILSTSEAYVTERGCDNGIEAHKRAVAAAADKPADQK